MIASIAEASTASPSLLVVDGREISTFERHLVDGRRPGAHQCLQHPNSLTDRSSGWPWRVAVRCDESSSTPAAGKTRDLAAVQGSDGQDEFGEVEGLGQVIIGAEAEAADPVPGGTGAGEHQDHDRPVGLGDHPAQHSPQPDESRCLTRKGIPGR